MTHRCPTCNQALAPGNGAVEADGLNPPFEIYHAQIEIGNQNGHVCSAENPEIAKALLARLNAAPSPAALDPVTVERCAKTCDNIVEKWAKEYELGAIRCSMDIRALIGQPASKED
jgi:hypothetical protein